MGGGGEKEEDVGERNVSGRGGREEAKGGRKEGGEVGGRKIEGRGG